MSMLYMCVERFTYFISPWASRTMAALSTNGSTHVDVTKLSSRQKVLSAATITEVSQVSKTVKMLSLKVKDNLFKFKPGQWVDFFIPGIPTVGGFSLCSSPASFKKENTVKLAIKYSDHPPAQWVHTKCRAGSEVHLRVGGDFYFDPQPEDSTPNLLLIAGGVGINPLYSIAKHISDLKTDHYSGYNGKTLLLFSAKNEDELLFKDSLQEISRKCPSVQCKFFVTKPGNNEPPTTNSIGVHNGRINQTRLEEALSTLGSEHLRCYICGPSPMIKDMSETLLRLGVTANRIHFERWW